MLFSWINESWYNVNKVVIVIIENGKYGPFLWLICKIKQNTSTFVSLCFINLNFVGGCLCTHASRLDEAYGSQSNWSIR